MNKIETTAIAFLAYGVCFGMAYLVSRLLDLDFAVLLASGTLFTVIYNSLEDEDEKR